MPVYEYICHKCSERFEKLVRSMSGKAAVPCPHCGCKRTERAMSTFAVGGEGPRASSSPARGRGGCGGGCCGGACSHR
ncbi:MAG: zinc ribbon domain-containing protein [Tepidisphaeraceae bacterium]